MKRGGWFVARGEEEMVMVAEAVSRWVEQSDAREPVRCGVSKRAILAPTVVWWMMIGVALPERAADLSMHACTAHSGMFEAKSKRRRVTSSVG